MDSLSVWTKSRGEKLPLIEDAPILKWQYCPGGFLVHTGLYIPHGGRHSMTQLATILVGFFFYFLRDAICGKKTFTAYAFAL